MSGICEPCEVEYDLAEGEGYISEENLAAIRTWHDRGHTGRPLDREAD